MSGQVVSLVAYSLASIYTALNGPSTTCPSDLALQQYPFVGLTPPDSRRDVYLRLGAPFHEYRVSIVSNDSSLCISDGQVRAVLQSGASTLSQASPVRPMDLQTQQSWLSLLRPKLQPAAVQDGILTLQSSCADATSLIVELAPREAIVVIIEAGPSPNDTNIPVNISSFPSSPGALNLVMAPNAGDVELPAAPAAAPQYSGAWSENNTMQCCCKLSPTANDPNRQYCCCGPPDTCCDGGNGTGFCHVQNCTAVMMGAVLLIVALTSLVTVSLWVHRSRVLQAHAQRRILLQRSHRAAARPIVAQPVRRLPVVDCPPEDEGKARECPVCLEETTVNASWTRFPCHHGTCRQCYEKLCSRPLHCSNQSSKRKEST
ncbi:hypothetical protein WJX73_006296 [Symbiochloris irregularis]|uniref:RING-type domain-containing protein n=1 Tax=Symbiochloris irregularis TaxID=706552 RepID=A0AAW1PZZ7_9CHLO